MKGDLLEGLFEDAASDPLRQMAGLLANTPPRSAKGYDGSIRPWLARVLPVVRSADQFVVALLL